ncbi:MAG TPA: tail fiber protein [Pyrinomonadaceae bacterium]|nr:tail fiber protein [Pyrinomonadaceae bacterium]
MGTPFLGELKIISWNYAPRGWAFCNGQFLPINQNQALFSLFGTMYGGNGQTTFALPNLRGRVPIHVGNGFTQGQAGGASSHTVTQSEMPQHIHPLNAISEPANTNVPANNTFLGAINNVYTAPANLVALAPGEIGSAGGSQPHENRQPFLVLNFIVALQGVFPSRN